MWQVTNLQANIFFFAFDLFTYQPCGTAVFHILEFLRNTPALSVIPVVMLSDSDHPDDIRQAYLLGASSYLVKPSSLTALKSLLRKIHEYWAECEVPEVNEQGYAVDTNSTGRLGARYKKPKQSATKAWPER